MGVGAIASAIVLVIPVASGRKWLILADIIISVIAAIIFSAQKLPPAPAGQDRKAEQLPPTGLRAWREIFREPGAVPLAIWQFLLGRIMVSPNVALSVLLITIWHLPPAVSPVLFAIKVAFVAILQTKATRALESVRRASQI